MLFSQDEYPSYYDEDLYDGGEDVEKRAWNSGFSGAMGKRAWNSGFQVLLLGTNMWVHAIC